MKYALPLVVFVAALALVTASVVFTLDRGPVQRTPVGNEVSYWDAARQAASGAAAPAALAGYPSPVYPRLLAPLASDDVGAVRRARRVLTAVFLPLIGILVMAAAWRRAGPWPGVIAGLAAAAAGPLALAAGTFTPAVPALVLALATVVALDGRRNLVSWAVAGLLVGVAFRFSLEIAWTLAAALTVAAILRPRETAAPAALRAAAPLLFLAVTLGTSAGIGRIAQTHDAAPSWSGIEIYRGHRSGASGVDPRRGDGDAEAWWGLRDFVRQASNETGARMTPAAAGSYWGGRGLKAAVTHPLGEIRRTGVKLLATLSGDPLARDVSPAFLRDNTEAPGLAVSVWIGRILLPLGLVGLILGRRRTGAILWAAASTGIVAGIITYAQADTRLLTLAVLAVGLGLFVEAMLQASVRTRLAGAAGAAAAVAVFGLWPAFGGIPGNGITGQDYFQLGALYDREGRGSAAMHEYEHAMRMNPGNPYPELAIASMLARDNVMEEASKELVALQRKNPDFVPGLSALARTYEHQERWPEAAAVYGHLIQLDPTNPEYYNNLATVDVQIGYYDQAIIALQKALAIDPGYATAKANLAGLQERGLAPGGAPGDSLAAAQERILDYIRRGDAAGAENELQAAKARFGTGHPEIAYIEGTLRLATGHPQEAVKALEPIRTRMGKNVIYLNNLAAAYAQSGELEKARATWKEALEIQPNNERIRRSLAGVEAAIDSSKTGKGSR